MRSCWGSEVSGAGSSRSWTAPPYASMPAPLTCSTSCPGSASRHRASASLLPHIEQQLLATDAADMCSQGWLLLTLADVISTHGRLSSGNTAPAENVGQVA